MGIAMGDQKLNYQRFDADKIIVVPLGDNHYKSKHCDEDLLRSHLDWILDSPDTYVLFGGDNIETATRDSVGAGVYEQQEIIDEQIDSWVNLMTPLKEAGKVIGMHSGNHEWRLFNSSGIDIAKIMAKQLGVKYFGWAVHHIWKVGGENYRVYSTHGNSGAKLPHTKIKSVIDKANISDAELYLMWHLHELSEHTRDYYSINIGKRVVEVKQKYFVLCGSYLNHWGSYAERAGYEMMRKGSPKVKLNGLEHIIRVSL